MRNAVINSGSTMQDVLGALTGTFTETVSGDWTIVRTPYFVVCTGTFPAGNVAVPFRFGSTVAASVAYNDETVGSKIIKVGQTAITLGKPGLVTILAFGSTAETSSLV